MKKIIFFLCLNLLFVPNILASTIVMDADTKRVLYESDMNREHLIASTSKILTALVVLKYANLSDKVITPYEVLKTTGSNIYIEKGEVLTVEELLYGLLLRSGNDAAVSLALHVSSSEDEFAKLMNKYASAIGMESSSFINASGLENEKGIGNKSTAYDMGILASHALKNKTLMTILKTKKKVVKSNYKTYSWTNKNKLLFNYKYLVGGKTGYTKKAGRTLVTMAKKNGASLIVVTLDEKDDFNLHKSLYQKYFKKYKMVTLVDKNLFFLGNNTSIKNNVKMLLNDKEKSKVKLNFYKTNDVTKRYGYLTVSLDNKVYLKEDIYQNEKKPFFKKIKEFFKKWI